MNRGRVERFASLCEDCMVLEDDCRQRGEFESAAEWSEQAEKYAARAFAEVAA